MKSKEAGNFIFLRVVLLCVAGQVTVNNVLATIDFNDGLPLTISRTIADFVRLDYMTPNNPGTELTLTNRGSISGIFELYNNSRAIISGGNTYHYTKLYDNSQITVNDGSLKWSITTFDESVAIFNDGTIGGGPGGGVWSYGNSKFIISGGRILAGGYATGSSQMVFSGGQIGLLKAWNNAQLTITGGVIDYGLTTSHHGQIIIEGSDFKINGFSVAYGDTAKDYGEILTEYINDGDVQSWSGVITGRLSDGTYMENEFYLNDVYGSTGNISFIPEPATILIFGLGGLTVWRRKFR